MKTLNMKLTGTENIKDVQILVDEKPVKFKKNQFNNLVGTYETLTDKVNIKIYKVLDIGGFFWFLTQIFFFLISIFGILDVRAKNKCLALQYESEVVLGENNNITLSCLPPRDKSKAFEVESNLQISETENKYFIDEKAKKKLKILLATKIIVAIAIVATAIALIVF